MKIKKIISASIAIIMTLCYSVSSLSATALFASETVSSDTLKLSVTSYNKSLEILAIQHLSDMKSVTSNLSETYGFTSKELLKMQIGNPFTIYVFDEKFQLVSSDNWVFPMLYGSNIVGVIESSYNIDGGNYDFTFGKAYGDELNELKNRHVGSEDMFFIGRYADTLFASNGKENDIFFDRSSSPRDITSVLSTVPLCKTIEESNYVNVLESISGTVMPGTPAMRYLVVLSVPHVAQGSGQICGVATLAAILNYRFSTSYTTASLTTAMTNQGYITTSNPFPSMQQYANFANNNHNAGMVYQSGAPTATTVINAIGASKPLMGNWSQPVGANHAIIIVGYFSAGGVTTYTVKNPWYNYTQTTTGYHLGANYVNHGVTWTLVSVIY